MTPSDTAAILDAVGLASAQVEPITGGWASWTFDVDGIWILRVARNDVVARAHRREATLLPMVAECLDIAVPVPTVVAEHAGKTYMVYRRLPGRPFQKGDSIESLATAIRSLHDVPTADVASVLGDDPSPSAWRAGYERDREWIRDQVLPELDDGLASELMDRFDAAIPELDRVRPVLVHRDLGLEHVLVDDSTGRVTGLIDFEDATLGDPAIDLVGVLASLGEHATRDLIRHYGEPAPSWERLQFYFWMGSVHAIRYGVETGEPEIIADGINGLRQRLRR